VEQPSNVRAATAHVRASSSSVIAAHGNANFPTTIAAAPRANAARTLHAGRVLAAAAPSASPSSHTASSVAAVPVVLPSTGCTRRKNSTCAPS
jgi:hypothetical protein